LQNNPERSELKINYGSKISSLISGLEFGDDYSFNRSRSKNKVERINLNPLPLLLGCIGS